MLQMRANAANIKIDRSEFCKIGDPRIIHLVDTPIREVNRAEYDRFLKNTDEGIRSIGNLVYEVKEESGFIDVLQFDTNCEELLQSRTNYDLRNGSAPFKPLPRRVPTMKMHF